MSDGSTPPRGKGDLLSGAVITAVGAYLLYASFGYGWFPEQDQVGPGLIPGVAGAVLVGLGPLIMVPGLRLELAARRRRDALPENRRPDTSSISAEGPTSTDAVTTDQTTTSHKEAAQSQHLKTAFSVLGLTVLAIFAAQWLGLLISLGLLTFLLLIWIEREGLPRSSVYAVVVGTTAWLLFEVLLNIQLPSGMFG